MNEFQAFALVGGLASVLVGITLETMLSRRADISAPLAGAVTVVFSSAGVGLALSPLLVATMRTGTLLGYGAGLVSFLLLGIVLFRIIESIRCAAQAQALPDH
jgi:uncharacterized protein (DUF697 family)